MIVILKNDVQREKRDQLIEWLKEQGLGIHISEGEYQTVLGLIGDTGNVDMELIESLSIVDSVKRVSESFKCCNRKFHPEDTVVEVGDVKIGSGHFAMIAGPCSVESEEQIVAVAKAVKASGANMLRGGAFKPRTSPYDFQGLKATGIELLKLAKAETGLPIVTEIMSVNHLPLFEDVDGQRVQHQLYARLAAFFEQQQPAPVDIHEGRGIQAAVFWLRQIDRAVHCLEIIIKLHREAADDLLAGVVIEVVKSPSRRANHIQHTTDSA